MSNYQPIIDKINELYITERKQYLILDNKGEYSTFTKGKNSPMALNDSLIKQHLQGKYTVGVFSGQYNSKFICFDIDMIDKSKVKWITLNLINTLHEIGIEDSYIHIASSGNKGIHVLLFSDKIIPLLHFKNLFIITMENLQDNLSSTIKSTLHIGNELTLEVQNICNIEFRANSGQGVKLELGLNFKNSDTDNRCLFMDKSTFELIEDINYFLNIQPMDSGIIVMISEEFESETVIVEVGKDLIKSNIKESHAHKINRDEDETLEFVKSLWMNGMTTSGSRNNSTFKLARYFSYMGLELEECIIELKEWLLKQDKKYYTSSIEFALSECERIAKSVYKKGYTLVGNIENLYIYKDELLDVMKVKEKNTKLVLFALLLHSKRFSKQNGEFYMTYKQIEEMCGLGRKSATNNIAKLEELELIKVVERDRKQNGTHIKRPNIYKITMDSYDVVVESVLEIDNSNAKLDYNDIYFKSVTSLFTDKEIRNIPIPNVQYREFKKYRELSA